MFLNSSTQSSTLKDWVAQNNPHINTYPAGEEAACLVKESQEKNVTKYKHWHWDRHLVS